MKQSFSSNRKTQKNFRLALLALGFLLLILTLSKSLQVLTSLQKPLNLNIQKQYFWDSKSSMNLVFVSFKSGESDISIISVDPREKKTSILKVANQIYMELPKGFGSWQVGSIYKLGQEEKPPTGANLLKLSLSKLLGLPIDGIILQNSQNSQTPQDLISKLRSNPLELFLFVSRVQTDLTLPEIFKVFGLLSSIREDKIVSLDMARSVVTESKLLPDSSRVLGVDSVQLDLYVRKNLSDVGIVDEGKSIAIYNGTGHFGLAQEAARIVTNMGGNVVITSSTENLQTSSGVYIQNRDDQSLTFNRLTEVFAPNCLQKKCESNDPKIINSRAQINIVLGEDYYNFWHER